MAARKRLGEILVQAGVLQEAQLRVALAEQRRWGGPLGRILVDMKLIPEETMVQALSHQLNFPAVNLDQREIPVDVVDSIPADLAEQHSVIPFNVAGKFLDVAMSDPTNLGIIDELRIRTRMNVRPYLAGPKMIERALARYYGRGTAPIDFGGGGGIASAVEIETTPAARSPAPAQRSGTPVQGVPEAPLAGQSSGPSPAAARRAQQFEFSQGSEVERREIAALQMRVQQLEALVARDEDVLRKLLSLFVEKGIATREEILERING